MIRKRLALILVIIPLMDVGFLSAFPPRAPVRIGPAWIHFVLRASADEDSFGYGETSLRHVRVCWGLPEISKSRFVIAVPNLRKSAAFYRDVLGFRVGSCGRLEAVLEAVARRWPWSENP